MAKPEWQQRVDEDMARVPSMTLGETLGFLANYSHRTFGDQIQSGELLLEQVRVYADGALDRAREVADEEVS